MEKKIFLLGGHDLEMQEIARLLDERQLLYFDRKLSWENATIEAYLPELEKYGNVPGICLYGIELQGMVEKEKYGNYISIDHHNEQQKKAASLLQVIDLLGVSPTREQLLIAANDAAYIPGMQVLGATPQEIADVRLRDRAAQGVTVLEEQGAQQAITENLEKQSDLIVVRALFSRFSPICDRLWPYQKLLIYTDDTLCYYGKGKDKLVTEFEMEIRKVLIYHGGGAQGFLGTVRGKWNPEEILRLKEKIIRIVQNM